MMYGIWSSVTGYFLNVDNRKFGLTDLDLCSKRVNQSITEMSD